MVTVVPYGTVVLILPLRLAPERTLKPSVAVVLAFTVV